MKEVLAPDNLKRVAEKFNFANEEDMFAAVGYSGITASQIVTRLTDKFRKQREEEEIVEVKEVRKPMKIRKWDSGVKVSGADNLLIRLSKCCNPVPGDDIVGYITKGRGVSIHRRDCVNVHTEEAVERLLEVEWEGSPEKKLSITLILKFQVTIAGLLNEVLQAVTETKTYISAVSGRSDRNKMATINMSISIRNLQHLKK